MSGSGKGTLYRRGRIWWIKYFHEEEPFYESSKSENRQDALTLLHVRLGELAKGVHPSWLKPSNTMAAILDLVPRDLQTYQRRDVTNPKRQIKKHLLPAFGDLPVKSFSTNQVHEYIAHRKAEGAENSTINRELATLRRALRLALEKDPPMVNRSYKIRMRPEDNVRMGYLTEEQYLVLRKELPDYQKLALVIGFYRHAARRGCLARMEPGGHGSQPDTPTLRADQGQLCPRGPDLWRDAAVAGVSAVRA